MVTGDILGGAGAADMAAETGVLGEPPISAGQAEKLYKEELAMAGDAAVAIPDPDFGGFAGAESVLTGSASGPFGRGVIDTVGFVAQSRRADGKYEDRKAREEAEKQQRQADHKARATRIAQLEAAHRAGIEVVTTSADSEVAAIVSEPFELPTVPIVDRSKKQTPSPSRQSGHKHFIPPAAQSKRYVAPTSRFSGTGRGRNR